MHFQEPKILVVHFGSLACIESTTIHLICQLAYEVGTVFMNIYKKKCSIFWFEEKLERSTEVFRNNKLKISCLKVSRLMCVLILGINTTALILPNLRAVQTTVLNFTLVSLLRIRLCHL